MNKISNLNSKNNQNSKSNYSINIDQQIESCYRLISAEYLDSGLQVEKGKPERPSSCKAVVNVTREIVKQKKTIKVVEVIYAFYSSHYHPNLLGSMAIYCKDISVMMAHLQKCTSLYGNTIRSISLQQGVTPFIDIQFDTPRIAA